MRDAVGEEYKHFSMDLEFLLRQKPEWREIAQGILFKEGDIVEHGEAAEAAAGEDDPTVDPQPSGPLRVTQRQAIGLERIAWHRKFEGARSMSDNHLLRAHAPISRAGWSLIDQEARERLVVALAARRLVDFSGPHGWEHSATNLGRTEADRQAPCEGVTAMRRRVLPLAEMRAPFTVCARGAARW